MKTNQFFFKQITLIACFIACCGMLSKADSTCRLEVPDDQHICAGQTIELCASGIDGYWWRHGEDKRCITVSPYRTTTYEVKGKDDKCNEYKKVTVNVSTQYRMPSSDDQHICKGQSVKICGEGADSYRWNTGEKTACITVSPSRTTTYEVVGTKNGCQDHDPIKVNVGGSIDLKVSDDRSICKGQSVEICAEGADGYWWSTDQDRRCITVSPSRTTTYTVIGKKDGCEAEESVKITVNDSFDLKVSDDRSICKGQSVEICAEGADHYRWSNGEERRCITVSPSSSKTFSVTGTKNGCEGSGEVRVNVSNAPTFGTIEDINVCAGESIELCGFGADSYVWNTGEHTRCITVSPTRSKIYSYVGTKNGCEGVGELSVNVIESFNLNTSGNQSICAGQTIEICAEGADNYSWSTGENRRCITVSPSRTTTYTVKGSKNRCEAEESVTISVNDSFDLKVSDDRSICAGQSVELCAEGADNYTWSNGSDEANRRCITVSPSRTTTYTVIGKKDGCKAEESVTISVNDSFDLKVSDDKSICKGQSVELCAEGADHYRWSNGEERRCITVSPSSSKTFSVTGTKNGCEGSGEVRVNVSNAPTFGTIEDIFVCAGESIELCGFGADSYVWNTGEHTRCITVSPTRSKIYSYVGTKNGCEGVGELSVNVIESFNLSTSGNQSICAGQSIEICAEGADDYLWSNGEERRCITVSPDHTKTYNVTGTRNGCEGNSQVTVNVNESFNLGISGDSSICSGQSIEICANGADNYYWNNGQQGACIVVSPDHTKTFSVIGDKLGCQGSGEITVNVNESFNLGISGDQIIHPGQSIEICASGANAYWWSNGSEGACITVSPDHTKTYTVIGTKNGCEGTAEITITVKEDRSCSINDIKLEEWTIGKRDAVIAWTEYSNVWYTLFIREAGGKWHEFATDYADVELTNLSMCTDYEWAVRVKCSNGALSDISHSRTFTTLGDCGNHRISSSDAIGVNQSIDKAFELTVFPNPANNLITIDYKGLSIQQSAIYNSLGKLVEYVDVDATGKATVTVKDYDSGVYLIMSNANDKLYKTVFVVN